MSDSVNSDITRREFVKTSVSAGFAAAVLPVTAFAVSTDSQGLTAGAIQIPTTGGNLPAYRAKPAKGGSGALVIVVHEIFGVHEHIQDVCRRFAKLGYTAIAPDLFFRQGDAAKIADIQELIAKIVSKAALDQVMSDLDATVKYATSSEGADANRIGITGFCWGGRTTWMYSAHNPTVKAGVAWYGPLQGTPNPLNPKNPVDIAPTLTVPVLGLYGGKDGHITADHVTAMEAQLKKGKSGSKIIVYPDAEHGFFADYRPSYNKKDAENGWSRLLEWFKEHKVA
jgi:carboxymethylenebutenolidase